MLDVHFMTLNILKLDFFHIPWIHYKLEGTLQKFVWKINLMEFHQNFNKPFGVDEINHLHSWLKPCKSHMGDTSLETTLTKGSHMLRRRGNMLNYQVIWKATVLCHTCVFHDVLCFRFTNGYNKVPIGHGFSYQACIMFLSMYQP